MISFTSMFVFRPSTTNETSTADAMPTSTTEDGVLENATETSFNAEDEDDSKSAQNALQYLANGQLPGDTGFDDEENDADYVPVAKVEVCPVLFVTF